MNRPVASLLASLVMVAFVRVPLVHGQEALDAFPAKTGVVVRIASVDKLVGGFNDLAAALGPLAAPGGANFEAGLGEMFHVGSNLDVLERTAPAYVAAFPLRDVPDPAARLVRTTDEAKLRRAVLGVGADDTITADQREDGFEKVTKDDRVWFFARRGEAVLYTASEAVVELLAFDPQQEKTLTSVVEPRAAELLAAGDAAVFVNVAELTESFASEIKQSRDDVLRGIEQLPKEALGASGADPQATRKMYADAAKLGFDTLFDARWAAARVNFSAAGVSAAGVLGVLEGSATDVFLAASPPVSFDNLGLLPAGAPAYFGFHWNYGALSSWTQDWMKLAYGGNSQQAEQLKASFEQMAQAGAGAMVGSFALPEGPESGVVSSVLQQAEDAQALRTGNRGYQTAIGEVKTPLFTQSVEYQEGAESYKDRSIDLLTQRFKLENVADPGLAIGQKFMQRIFGGDAIQSRVTAVEGLLIQTSGNDAKYLHRVIDGLESGEGVLGLEEAFSKTRDQLADEANLILLANTPQLFVDSVKMIRDIPPFDIVLAQTPFNFGAQPAVSYGGISIGTEPQGLRVQAFVPVGQPKGIMQIFGQGF